MDREILSWDQEKHNRIFLQIAGFRATSRCKTDISYITRRVSKTLKDFQPSHLYVMNPDSMLYEKFVSTLKVLERLKSKLRSIMNIVLRGITRKPAKVA